MTALNEWDDVWIGDYLGTVTNVSQPFKFGNITDSEGNAVFGREYTIFIEEDLDG